jgi:nickel/cobalt transporter (NicO) family protein
MFISIIFNILYSFESSAHIIKNSLTTTTTLHYNQDKNLYINYDISIPSPELDLVYNYIDLDQNRTMDENEKKQLLTNFQNIFYIESEGLFYKPLDIEITSNYNELTRVIFPTLQLRLDMGKVEINKEFKNLSIYNKIQFNTSLPQDWNFGDKNEGIEVKDIAFYPKKDIISNQINAQVKSQFGIVTPNFFSKITNNQYISQLKTFLKNPDYSINSILSILFVCLLFGIVHSFQPGHGKAIIGSYLAGIKGNFKDSIVMAISTTISHTAIIIFLGLLWAILKDGLKIIIPIINLNIVIPKELVNILQLAVYIRYFASVALILTGIYMAFKYYRMFVDYKLEQRFGTYNEVLLDIESGKTYTIVDHGDHKHIVYNKKLGLKQAIWLGINTGMTPCLDALILFTIAISFGLGWLGFGMIVTFSIGLGLSLAMIGYLSAKTISLASKKFSNLEQLSLILPIFSSIAIIILAIINLFA